MRRQLTLCLLLIASICCVFAKKERLHTHLTEKGQVYYVGSKSLSKLDKGLKEFAYDLTYIEGGDSVTVNFTVVSPNANDVSALTIGNGKVSIQAEQIELLYHEMNKKNFKIRTTSKVLYSELKEMLQANQPICFTATHTDGETQSAKYSASQWKKENEVFKGVFYLINK